MKKIIKKKPGFLVPDMVVSEKAVIHDTVSLVQLITINQFILRISNKA